MSTLSVDTITKADGSGSLSVPAESGTVVTTASPSLGRRNLIINGAMQVAQRGTSTTTDGGYVADRFINYQEIGTFTAEQSTDAPDDFTYSLKRTNGTGTTATGFQYALIRYRAEGFDVAHLNQSTASAKTVTVSFWVKSSVTGTYIVALSDSGDDYQYPASYTVNSVNTWEQKSVTITGYTGGSGSWSTTNGVGLILHWDLGSGPNRQATTANTWNSNANAWSHSSQVDWVGTTGATFYITGVQLEVGSVATPFEHRSYGEELALCKRYFERFSSNTTYNISMAAGWSSGTDSYLRIDYDEKRSNPSISASSGSNYLRGFFGGDATLYANTISTNGTPYRKSSEMYIAHSSGTNSGGEAGWWRINDSGFYIDVDAEL